MLLFGFGVGVGGVVLFLWVSLLTRRRQPGAVLLQGLENGLSKLPALDGRFLHVSTGVQIMYDLWMQPGNRVLSASFKGLCSLLLHSGWPLTVLNACVCVWCNDRRGHQS